MAENSLQELSDQELIAELKNHKQKLLDLRFKLATGALEDTTRIKAERKTVARIKTELRIREIAAAEVEAATS